MDSREEQVNRCEEIVQKTKGLYKMMLANLKELEKKVKSIGAEPTQRDGQCP